MDNTKLTITLKNQKDVIHAAIFAHSYNWLLQSVSGKKLTVYRENPSSYNYDNVMNTIRDLSAKYPITAVQFGYYHPNRVKEIESAA
jgi:uncharacterized protein (DUF2141 family)